MTTIYLGMKFNKNEGPLIYDAQFSLKDYNDSLKKYNVRSNDINKIQNILERNQRSIQNIKESKMHNKQNYSLKEILDFSEVYIKPDEDDRAV